MPPSLRLLVVVNVYSPDLGGGILFSDLLEGLVERGIDVTVRCAYPYYPEWTDKTGRNGLAIHRYEDRGVHVERLGIFIPGNPNSLVQRMVYESSFFLSLLRTLPGSRQFDLVMAYCPLVGGVAFGAVLKLLYRKRLWLNVQDLSAAAAAASGIASGGTMGKVLESIQSALFNRAEVWSTISPVMREKLRPIARHNQPVLLFPNWMHRSLEQTVQQFPRDPDHRPASPVRLLYSGNLGTKQDLQRLCESLRSSDVDFIFEIRAAGSTTEALREWAIGEQDDRFQLSGLSDEDDLAKALQQADLFVITEKSGSGGSFIPSKLVPAAAAGTPVLAISDRDSPLGAEVIENQIGIHHTWEDVHRVAETLADLATNPTYSSWQKNSRSRASYYARDTVIDRYYRHIVEVATDRSPSADDHE
jgi:colanic acid biosynthesis glycosyl transferase WcaI